MSLISSAKIESAKTDPSVLLKTFAQIQRDLELSKEDFHIQEGEGELSNYEDLINQLTPIIDYLLNHHPSRFFTLLYQVDLPEAKVKEVLFDDPIKPVHKICSLIVERELLKVLTKMHFSELWK